VIDNGDEAITENLVLRRSGPGIDIVVGKRSSN
jgi:hypothetical protein